METNLSKASLYCISAYFFIISTSFASTNKNIANTVMSEKITAERQFSAMEKQIAAKMAIDIRYFCADAASQAVTSCLTPVTELPKVLADMITATGIGSVVLFAENLSSTAQIVKLTDDLQRAALQSESEQPLIISIDQEGGRVVRLPQATSFAGNMAIGATYKANGVKFAAKTSTVIAKELKALGINNNYAPVVDVNTNANNPVINTRSFGDNPQMVAELGAAAVNGFQQNSVMATLKHFPGHGDTHVDSHLGLPLVGHGLATIAQQDLAPFKWIIDLSDPAMIMTAHIQYPALDNSMIENNAGDKIIRPATMSRKILTDLLREEMGFDGIIATDALDMAGISHYFDQVTAVVETFMAGADLAVMPFKIRTAEDIDKFAVFIKAVAQALQQKIVNNEFSEKELAQSISRINRYKTRYIKLPETPITKQIDTAKQVIAQPQHLALEQSLADNAVVLLTNKKRTDKKQAIPVDSSKIDRIHLFVLNWQEFRALKQAIVTQWQKLGKVAPSVSATVVSEGDAAEQLASAKKVVKADLVIATIDTKIASVVDIGGVEDLITTSPLLNEAQDKINYAQLLTKQLQQADQQKVSSILVAKGSPYLLQPYTDLADAILVTFDDRIYQKHNTKANEEAAYSPGYNTAMAIVFGKQNILGKLPVTLEKN